jgi:hypothetical protein
MIYIISDYSTVVCKKLIYLVLFLRAWRGDLSFATYRIRGVDVCVMGVVPSLDCQLVAIVAWGCGMGVAWGRFVCHI